MPARLTQGYRILLLQQKSMSLRLSVSQVLRWLFNWSQKLIWLRCHPQLARGFCPWQSAFSLAYLRRVAWKFKFLFETRDHWPREHFLLIMWSLRKIWPLETTGCTTRVFAYSLELFLGVGACLPGIWSRKCAWRNFFYHTKYNEVEMWTRKKDTLSQTQSSCTIMSSLGLFSQ